MAKRPVSLTLRVREAAEALGICERTLYQLTAPRGPIPCVRIGRGKRKTVLYSVDVLREWVNQQSVEQQQKRGGVK